MYKIITSGEFEHMYPTPTAKPIRSPIDTLPTQEHEIKKTITLTTEQVIQLMLGESLTELNIPLTPEQIQELIDQINAGYESAQLHIQTIESTKISPITPQEATQHYLNWRATQKPYYEKALREEPKRRQSIIEQRSTERLAGSSTYIEYLRQNMNEEDFQLVVQEIYCMDAIQLLVEADALAKLTKGISAHEGATIVGLCAELLMEFDDGEGTLFDKVKNVLPNDAQMHAEFESRRAGIYAEVFIGRYLQELATEWGIEPDLSFTFEKTSGSEDANGVDFIIRMTNTDKRFFIDVKSFSRTEIITSTSTDGIITRNGSTDSGDNLAERYSIPGGLTYQLRPGVTGISIRVPHEVFLPGTVSLEEQEQFKMLLKGKLLHALE